MRCLRHRPAVWSRYPKDRTTYYASIYMTISISIFLSPNILSIFIWSLYLLTSYCSPFVLHVLLYDIQMIWLSCAFWAMTINDNLYVKQRRVLAGPVWFVLYIYVTSFWVGEWLFSVFRSQLVLTAASLLLVLRPCACEVLGPPSHLSTSNGLSPVGFTDNQSFMLWHTFVVDFGEQCSHMVNSSPSEINFHTFIHHIV